MSRALAVICSSKARSCLGHDSCERRGGELQRTIKERKGEKKRERERRGGSVRRKETIAIERECDKRRVLGVKKY